LARGLTPRRVALLVYGVCGVGAGLSLLQSAFHEKFAGITTIVFCAAVWIGIQRLGYAEFDMARRIVLAGTLRRLLDSQLRLVTLRQDLVAAHTPDRCWEVLQHVYSDFGFTEIKLRLGGRFYSHTTNGHHVPNVWTIQIALSGTEYVRLSHEIGTNASPVITPFADVISKVLQTKTTGLTSMGQVGLEEVNMNTTVHG